MYFKICERFITLKEWGVAIRIIVNATEAQKSESVIKELRAAMRSDSGISCVFPIDLIQRFLLQEIKVRTGPAASTHRKV